MGIVIDVSIVLAMVAFVYMGYRKGLIKVAISFVAVLISILIALILFRPIASQIMANTDIDESISNTIYEQIENIDFNNISDEEKNNNGIMQIAQGYVNEALESSKDNTARYVSDSLTITIVEGLTFLGLLIVLRLLLLVLNVFADMIGSLPIIKQFNKSGGIVYGIIEGFLVINLILALLYMLNPIVSNGVIKQNIDKSYLGKIVYENNFIVNSVIK